MASAQDPTQELGSFRALAHALGLDSSSQYVVTDVEGWIVDRLDTDLGNSLFVEWTGDADEDSYEELHLWTDLGVTMHILTFPLTQAALLDYLTELDTRSKRMQAIAELPRADEGDQDDDGQEALITGALATLFNVPEDEVITKLGRSLTPVASNTMGTFSMPARCFLWQRQLIVGLDDEYIHLFATTFDSDGLIGTGDELSAMSWGDDGDLSLNTFVSWLVQVAQENPAAAR